MCCVFLRGGWMYRAVGLVVSVIFLLDKWCIMPLLHLLDKSVPFGLNSIQIKHATAIGPLRFVLVIKLIVEKLETQI